MIFVLFESAMKDTLSGDWCFSWCFSWVLFSFSIRFSRMLFLCVSSSVLVLCFVVMLSMSFFQCRYGGFQCRDGGCVLVSCCPFSLNFFS